MPTQQLIKSNTAYLNPRRWVQKISSLKTNLGQINLCWLCPTAFVIKNLKFLNLKNLNSTLKLPSQRHYNHNVVIDRWWTEAAGVVLVGKKRILFLLSCVRLQSLVEQSWVRTVSALSWQILKSLLSLNQSNIHVQTRNW